eukprot:jgi/Chlat1/5706/Chrsp38S05545
MAFTRAVCSSLFPTCLVAGRGSGCVTRRIKPPPANMSRPVSKLAIAKRKVLPRLTGTITTSSASNQPKGDDDGAYDGKLDPDWLILEPFQDSTIPHLRFIKKSELESQLADVVSDLRVLSRALQQHLLLAAVKVKRMSKEEACELYNTTLLCTGRVKPEGLEANLQWHPFRPRYTDSDGRVSCTITVAFASQLASETTNNTSPEWLSRDEEGYLKFNSRAVDER